MPASDTPDRDGGFASDDCGCPDDPESGGGRRPAMLDGRGPVGRTCSTTLSTCSTRDAGDARQCCPHGLELDGTEDAPLALPRSSVGREEARTRCSFVCDSGSRRDCCAGSAGGDDEVEVHVVPCRGVEARSERSGSTEVPAGLPSPWAGLFTDSPKGHYAGEDSHSLPSLKPSAKSTDSEFARKLDRVQGATHCGCMLCWVALADACFACCLSVVD